MSKPSEADAWDGYHWTLTRQMAQDGEWVPLKAYMDTKGEMYLREYMEHRDYWTACLEEEEGSREHGPLDDRDFVKTGVES